MTKSSLYYPELDSLRFFAFLVVLIHHSPVAPGISSWVVLSKYGWAGVDLFLCLSAYLFAKLLFVEHQEKGDIHIGYFYLRRLLRIWPLYFFFFGAMLIYAVFNNGWNAELLRRSIGMLTFTDNLFTMARGYNVVLPYSDHLWTISYEEQFYLLIPWALRVFYRLQKSTTALILGAVFLLGTAVRAIFIYNQMPHPAIWVFPLTHFESILGGLILGLGVFDKYLNRLSSWLYLAGGLAALWAVTLLPNVQRIQWKLMFTYPLVGIGTSLILLAFMNGGMGSLSRWLQNQGLRYLGKISYGLYVYHLLGLALATNLITPFVSPDRQLVYPVVTLIVTLLITIILSMLSYELLEKSFLRMKERFTLIDSRPV